MVTSRRFDSGAAALQGIQMTLSAYITLDRDGFNAALSDGRALRAPEIRALAAMLVSAGVHVDHAHCADWRAGDAAPGAGHAIALKAEMRRLV